MASGGLILALGGPFGISGGPLEASNGSIRESDGPIRAFRSQLEISGEQLFSWPLSFRRYK